VVAAAQDCPVGDSATACERTCGRFLPPVPGSSLAPAGPPALEHSMLTPHMLPSRCELSTIHAGFSASLQQLCESEVLRLK
jgi:hypothetical protein